MNKESSKKQAWRPNPHSHPHQLHSWTDSVYLHLLTDAEKRGSDIIDKARKRRMIALRRAKEEASGELETIKTEYEQKLNDLQLETQSYRDCDQDSLSEIIEENILELESNFKLKLPELVEFILDKVFAESHPIVSESTKLMISRENTDKSSALSIDYS